MNDKYPRSDRAWEAADTLKSLAMMLTSPDGEKTPLVICLPGDREVDTRRLESAMLPAIAEPFTEADFEKYPELVKGYMGPKVLGENSASGIRCLVDPRVVTGTSWIAGGDQVEKHVVNLVVGRDFTPDGVIDVAQVLPGDPAPDGSGPLELARGIEIGHIFQLGRKYAESLELKVLDVNGKLITPTMGSYGVGVSRAVGVIAEHNNDEKGLIWPVAVAPFQVQIVAAGKDEKILDTAFNLAEKLAKAGVEVLVDDRKASPGVKFADAELMGMPKVLVVGRGLANGVVELRDRASGDRVEVPVDEAADTILAELAN
nr:MAG: hypothetical protein CR979_00625 [Propionibacterium sp.]